MNVGVDVTEFPSQKISDKRKTKNFFKKCANAAIDNFASGDVGHIIRQTKKNIDVNFNLYNDILSPEDIEEIGNPLGIKFDAIKNDIEHYPIGNSKLDLLLGEEIKRKFDYLCMVINPEAVSEKTEKEKEFIIGLLTQEALQSNFDEAKVEKQIANIGKLTKWSVQDMREKRGSEYLEYLWRQQDLKTKFSQGMMNVFLAAEECYATEIVNGKIFTRVIDPRNLIVVRSGQSHYIEDADLILEFGYMSKGSILDKYKLTEAQVTKLDSGMKEDLDSNKAPKYLYPISNHDYTIDIEDTTTSDMGITDANGNIRVVRVCWRSMRKLGTIKWNDEDGEEQEKTVDEFYVINDELGEKVEWKWVSEWLTDTVIGHDIHTAMEALPRTVKPYIGTIYSTGTSRAVSLMDRIKPFNYLYDILMERVKQAFIKTKGKLGVLDLATIPEGWTLDMALYYPEYTGWVIKDSFTEGDRGASQGKLAGNMNQGSNTIDTDMGNYIQQHVSMLAFIDQKIGDIIGVSRQREGQITSSETVGGVERSVTQSSHITEKWFMMHDHNKIRVLRNLLEAAKYAWRGKKEPLQYISTNMTRVISEIDGDMLSAIEYGIDITSSSDDNEMFSFIKESAKALIQHDQHAISKLAKIIRSNSLAAIQHQIENIEEQAIQKQEEKEEADRNVSLQISQAETEQKILDRELKKYEIDKESLTKLQVVALQDKDEDNNDSSDSDAMLKKIEQAQEKIDNDYKLKKEALNIKEKEYAEKVRSNKAKEKMPVKAIKK